MSLETKKERKVITYFIIAFAIICLDQLVKYLSYQYLKPVSHVSLMGDWCKLQYETNPGMAFGATFGGKYGKLILSSFRFVAMFAIGYYIYKLHMKKAHKGLIMCIAFILAGAVGNLVDSAIYGYFSPDLIAKLPDANGFLTIDPPFKFLHGRVIDMLYFDIWDGEIFGYHLSLWPIFNVADAAIFCSVIVILFKQKTYFKDLKKNKEISTSKESIPEQS